MPTIQGNVTSFDVPSNVIDISDIFYSISHPATPLFNIIRVGDALVRSKFHWWEDVLLSRKTTLDEAYTAGDGHVHLVNAKPVRPGTILIIEDSVYRVLTPEYGTDIPTIDIVSNDQDHANSLVVDFANTARKENSEPKDSDFEPEIKVENATQISDDTADVSGTEQATDREVNNGSFIDQQIDKKLRRIFANLGKEIWTNPRVIPATKADAGLFGGIYFFIDLHGYTPSAATFNVANFDAFLFEMDQTYRNNMMELWLNPDDMSRFVALNDSKVRVAQDTTVVGVRKPTVYFSDKGYEIELRTDPGCTLKKLTLMESSQVLFRPLQGRQFGIEDLPKTKDGLQKRVLGEHSLEVNPASTMGIFEIT